MNDKAKMGRPPVDTQSLTLRLSSAMIAALDAARKREDDLPNRQEMIRRILDAYLKNTVAD